jgi:hypothetical protein
MTEDGMQGKRDYAIMAAVIGGIFAIIAAVVGALLVQHNKPGMVPNPVVSNSAPIVTPAPIVTATDEEQRQRMRQQHNVRRMEVLENELKFSVAPRGIFGFTQTVFIYDPSHLKLKREFSESLDFEIHKMTDGNGQLIGFVSPDTAVKLQRDDRPAKFLVTIYNSMWSGASIIVPIRLSDIQKGYSDRTIQLDDNTRIRALDATLK